MEQEDANKTNAAIYEYINGFYSSEWNLVLFIQFTFDKKLVTKWNGKEMNTWKYITEIWSC